MSSNISIYFLWTVFYLDAYFSWLFYIVDAERLPYEFRRYLYQALPCMIYIVYKRTGQL